MVIGIILWYNAVIVHSEGDVEVNSSTALRQKQKENNDKETKKHTKLLLNTLWMEYTLLPVHWDQLRAQCSVTSMGELYPNLLYFLFLVGRMSTCAENRGV